MIFARVVAKARCEHCGRLFTSDRVMDHHVHLGMCMDPMLTTEDLVHYLRYKGYSDDTIERVWLPRAGILSAPFMQAQDHQDRPVWRWNPAFWNLKPSR